MATIRDVAQVAGVSVASVSRYMNQKGYVSQDSAKRIQEAIQTLNYVPNEIARSLNSKSSRIVGVLVPDLTNPYFPLIIKGIEDGLRQDDYMMILANTEEDQALSKDLMKSLLQYNISGLIKMDQEMMEETYSVPYVAIDRASKQDKFSVLTNDFEGGSMQGKRLLKTDASSVLIMSGPQHLQVAQERLKGLESVLDKSHLQRQYWPIESYKAGFAKELVCKILDANLSFDSLVAANDIYALAFIKEAQSRGIRIPEDIQVIGYDGIAFGEYASPSLTTIQQPAYEIGYEASRMLVNLMQGLERQDAQSHLKLQPHLVERKSLRIE